MLTSVYFFEMIIPYEVNGSTEADPPEAGDGSNEAPRTVKNFTVALLRTLAIAFPA